MDDGKLHFAAVNDNANTAELFTLTFWGDFSQAPSRLRRR